MEQFLESERNYHNEIQKLLPDIAETASKCNLVVHKDLYETIICVLRKELELYAIFLKVFKPHEHGICVNVSKIRYGFCEIFGSINFMLQDTNTGESERKDLLDFSNRYYSALKSCGYKFNDYME